MNSSNDPANNQLPTTARLIKSTAIAIIAAAVILVTAVLPAEYGIDPTGIGSMLGLTKMGEIKVSLAEEAAADLLAGEQDHTPEVSHDPEPKAAPDDTEEEAPGMRSDEITLALEPGQGKEIKLTMEDGADVNYEWWTDGGKANFDTHADSKALEIKYHNYEKGKLERSSGTLTAEFAGNHGWFWRNRTETPMTVTLKVTGAYSDVLQF